jgi:asparagine synthase (glutamine-hydrolysing)
LANFVVVVDTDEERRAQFIRTIQPRMAIVGGQQLGFCSHEDCCVVWASAPQAPVSQVADSKGAAVLWGEAIPGPGPERVDAIGLRDQWRGVEQHPPSAYDGFYAGVVHDSQQGLIVGADLLGLFPVYYGWAGGALLVGASPEMFRHHSAFRMEFNPAGLVGILLTNGLVEGQTLIKGVKRLSSGHLLIWRRDDSPREVLQYQVPLSTRYSDLTIRAHVEILDKALEDSIKCHVPPGRQYGLLLSGGLDSRLVGGYLKDNHIEAEALTWGLPTDFEMQCATPVARTLGFPHHTFEPTAEDYITGAQLQANYEYLANGFNQVRMWGLPPTLRDLSTRVVTGLVLDKVISPLPIYESPFTRLSDQPFENVLTLRNEAGIRPEVLKKLLRGEVFGDLVQDMFSCLRNEYANAADSDFRRGWRFELWHRARFHVGSGAHRLTFGSWPVLPALNRQLFEVLAGMPAASVDDRLVEKELLCTRFPELASLPLDRSSYNTLPLKPRLRQLLSQHLQSRFDSLRRVLRALARRKMLERRFWTRTTDFNGPGWLGVRRIAEPNRKQVYCFFRRDVFDSIVPAADIKVQNTNGMVSGSGIKLLLGTMLWAGDHL